MTNKLSKIEVAGGLSDKALARETARVAAALPPHYERVAYELAALVRPPEASRRAGLTDKGGAPYDIAHREDVQELVALLREAARRKAVVTASSQIQRVQALAEKAEDKGDISTAVTAEKEVSKLAGVYPETGTGEASQRQTLRIEIPTRPELPPMLVGASPAQQARELAAWHARRAKALEAGEPATWSRPALPREPRQAEPAASAVVEVEPSSPDELDLEKLLS